MTRDEITRHKHYKPAGKSPVCGFTVKLLAAVERGECHRLRILDIPPRPTSAT